MVDQTTSLGDAAIAYRPTVIEFILDETPSMIRFHGQTISGYNTFINEQRDVDGQALMTLTKFAVGVESTPFSDLDLKMVVPMTKDTFVPGGNGTNLRDVLGRRVRQLEARLENWTVKPNVLVILMTDGADNSSREYQEHHVRDMIKARESDGWTFVFLGACKDALHIAKRLGFQDGNSKEFEGEAMEQTMTELSTATTAYWSARGNSEAFTSTSYFG